MTGKRKRRRDEMKDESSSAIEMMCYVQQSQREKERGKERRNEGRKEGAWRVDDEEREIEDVRSPSQ